MSAATTFRIEISNDRLSATVVAETGAKINAPEVMAALRSQKIKDFDDGALIEALEAHKEGALAFVVAKGTAAVDERSAKVQFRVPFVEIPVGVTRVEVGATLAVTTSATPGTDGRDVFGQPIPHARSPLPFELGDQITNNKGVLTANARGNLRLVDRKLSVVPLHEIHGDEPGEVRFEGDVAVKGSLREGQIVHIGGCLFVGGAMEATDVRAGGSAKVKGAIIGKGKCNYIIGGDLWCRFITAGRITAAGNVYVQGEVVRSYLTCGGRLFVEHGPIAGGEIGANGGITCQTIGSSTGVATVVEAGADRAQLALAAELSREIAINRERADTIREKIAPLMKHLKTLTSQQREKVTELMSEAGELEDRAASLDAELSKRCQAIRDNSRAEIIVKEAVYGGVTIRFPGVEAIIPSALKGPFRLSPRRAGGTMEVLLTDPETNFVSVLPSRPIATAGLSVVNRAKAA